MLEFRAALRAGLARLESDSGSLRCVYSSTSTDFCDAENVLLYNVGMASFGGLTARSVTFERRDLVPPCATSLSGPALHHVRYSTEPETTFVHWKIAGEVAMSEAPLPARVDKAAGWWWAMRTGSRSTNGVDLSNERYALRVEVGGLHRSTASVLKPMLDGIIASLHRDDSPTEETVGRLSSYLQEAEDPVRAALMQPDAALGSRILVRPFREGLQWNPADDLCVACSVENGGPSSPRVVRGRLLRVMPVPG